MATLRAAKLVHEPLQERSRATLERIVSATESLLDEKLFEELTIVEIVRRAKTSVGAFYERFDSKDALLPYLYRRYDQNLGPRIALHIAPEQWKGVPLAGRIARLVSTMVSMYRQRRGLLRAVALYSRSNPAAAKLLPHEKRSALYEQISALLLECRDEIDHVNPRQAVQFGFFFAAAACRDKILFEEAPHPASVKVSDKQLADELTLALIRYLGAKQ